MWCLRWTQSLAIITLLFFLVSLERPISCKVPFLIIPPAICVSIVSVNSWGMTEFTSVPLPAPLHTALFSCLEFSTCFGPFGLKVQQTGFFAGGWKQWAKCTFFPLFNFNWRQQIKLQYYNITKIFLSPFYFSNETFHFQMLSVGSFPGGCVKPKSSFSEGNVSIRHARSPQAAGVLK